MPAVSTKAGGSCFAFPDVCFVPTPAGPTPVPFPNTALCADAQGTISSVTIEGAPVIVESSTIPMSTGDEAGTGGGIVSGVFRGPAQFKTASAKVHAKGKRVVLAGAVTGQNGTNANAIGQQITASQTRVVAAT